MENNGLIKEMLSRMAGAYADRTAFCIKNGVENREISYREFCRDILTAAGWFRKNGIQGQNVAVIAPANYWFYAAFFGVMASGNVAAVMNPDLGPEMLNTLCRQTDVLAAYADTDVAGELEGEVALQLLVTPERLQQSEPMPLEDVYNTVPDENIMLIFTSGTTGVSKAAQHTSGGQAGIMRLFDEYYTAMGLESSYHVLPRYHMRGMHSMLSCFYRGETLYVGRGIRYMIQDLAVFNPHYAIMVPAMAASLVKMIRKSPDPNAREKFAGKNLKRLCLLGAAITPALVADLAEIGIEVEADYGMSETGTIAWSVIGLDKPGSTGQVCPTTQIRIQDGEILVKTPSMMKGYYKQPEETAKVLIDGWIHTGDLGHLDGDNHCYLTGRKKNVIITSNGENVSPEELEAKLSRCDAVLECMVYGDQKGICADIYTQEPEAVKQYVKSYNRDEPMYRQIYKVNYLSEPLEKTGSGKIKRKENVYV